jgi:putative tricarboxylic transport membrane protein
MTVFTELLGGFATVFSPTNLLLAALGVTLGTLVGVLPGIGPAVTIALLLPVTFQFDDPAGAFIMFAGIYYGAMYGGSTTSILLNTPGESASVATALEGHAMARRGRARAALATAAIGSFVAGTIATVLLTFVAKPIGHLATSFTAADYTALMVFSLVSVTALVGRSIVRGMLALLFGVTLGLVGLDALSGQARLTFGQPLLYDGISEVILIIGLFAIG